MALANIPIRPCALDRLAARTNYSSQTWSLVIVVACDDPTAPLPELAEHQASKPMHADAAHGHSLSLRGSGYRGCRRRLSQEPELVVWITRAHAHAACSLQPAFFWSSPLLHPFPRVSCHQGRSSSAGRRASSAKTVRGDHRRGERIRVSNLSVPMQWRAIGSHLGNYPLTPSRAFPANTAVQGAAAHASRYASRLWYEHVQRCNTQQVTSTADLRVFNAVVSLDDTCIRLSCPFGSVKRTRSDKA